MKRARWAQKRNQLAESVRAVSETARNPSLLRAQLAFGASWSGDWAFLVALGVIAFRDGGAAAVGIVAFARMAPSFVLVPAGTALADRFRRDYVLIWSCALRAVATAAAALVLAADGPASFSGPPIRPCCRRSAPRRSNSRAPTSSAASRSR